MNLDPATTYYWRAILECYNILSPSTPVWSFTSSSGGTILAGPTLLSPAHNTTLPVDNATLLWNALQGAVEYTAKWHLSGQPEFEYSAITTSSTQTSLSWGLDPNTTYEWWVSARNDYALGGNSTKWLFTTGNGTGASSSQPSQSYWTFIEDGGEVRVPVE